jgi:malate dehydrogenase (quinone)
MLNTADGSIAGLLGASPGASTAVPAMLDVIRRCFPNRCQSWLPKLKEMVPSLGTKLSEETQLFEEVWEWGSRVLGLGGAAAIGETAAPAAGSDGAARKRVDSAVPA